jgi:hypothetical protein
MPGNMMETSIPKLESSTLENIGKPIPVYVTNMGIAGMGEGAAGIMKATGEVADEGLRAASQDLADISAEIAANTEEASASSEGFISKIKSGFSSIGDWISGLFSSSGGGSSTASNVGGLAMTAVSAYGRAYGGGYGFAEGGVISEPIVGAGLRSGEIYNFGENTKYGENEIVAPMKKMQRSVPQNKVEYHMPIHLSAIDTQSGIQFLVKHSDVIQGQMVRNLKQNKPIRKGIQNAY